MRRDKIILILVFVATFIIFTSSVWASDTLTFVTIVHPIRSRSLWVDSSLDNLKRHMQLTDLRGLPATYLLQYETLDDEALVSLLQESKNANEIGIWLEVSERLATDSFVPYTLGSGDWARPDKVFFSGYTLWQRRRLVDRLIHKFERIFGYPPKSVGAWYIDPQTLGYLYDRYHIKAALTVSDQYSTDQYHIWGKYFGVPYYPSRYNTLVPAQTLENRLPVVVTQWAQRDLYYAYGPSVDASTFSTQANDYQGHHSFSNDYFKKLYSVYSDADKNNFAQITVGLEVGQEIRFLPELLNQIEYIYQEKEQGRANVITLSDFATWYSNKFPDLSPTHMLISGSGTREDPKSLWFMSPWYRLNIMLRDGIIAIRDYRLYNEEYIEKDFFFADKRQILFRTVPAMVDAEVLKNDLTLKRGVNNLSIHKEGEDFILTILSPGQENLTITLTKTKLEGVKVTNGRKKQKIPSSFIGQAEFFFSNLPSLLYSEINNKKILGLPIDHEGFIGLQLFPIRLILTSFPFQVRAHFLKIPSFSLEHLVKVDPDDEIENYLRDNSLVVRRRERLTVDQIAELEKLGKKRVFENSHYSVWTR